MALCFAITCACLAGCRPVSDGKVHVTYWEKWSGAEAEAMQHVVDQFNQSQDRIVVEVLSTPSVDRKTLIATAGGDPPDLAGMWLANVYSFADRDALMPLDDFIKAEGLTTEAWLARYYPVYSDSCVYRGTIWSVFTTPTSTALHWNKAMFRAAGLDPDRPPKTLAELDAFAERLTKRNPATGEITQLGFLPQEPGWFSWAFPQWFGGQLFDGTNITLGTNPANLEAYRWVANTTRRYGLESVRTFTSGFGNFGSSQNPFMAGQVAMVIQGVWMNNYIRQFAPGLDYGVAPWPSVVPGLDNFTCIDADVLVIPRGAKHPREAWEFAKFLNTTNPKARTRDELRGMELLCYLQEKNSPLREWSPYFTEHHPHPNIDLFRQLSASSNAIHIPKVGMWQNYGEELGQTFDNVRLLTQTPEEALALAQERVATSWALHQRSIERRTPQSPTTK